MKTNIEVERGRMEMANVSFIKTPEEVQYFLDFGKNGVNFDHQEGLYVAWLTKPEIVQKLVPPPLEPIAPIVVTYTSYFYETNFWKDYNEGALFIPVQYKGKKFSYCLAMPIAGRNDIPIFFGREGLGYPKKNVDELAVVRRGDQVKVWIERHGIRYFEVEAEIGDYNDPLAENLFGSYKDGAEVLSSAVNFKYNIDLVKNKTKISNVQLVESLNKTKFYTAEKARVKKITLQPSIDDPWAELEVVKPLGASYCKYSISMYDSEVLADLDAEKYAPYLFARWDASMVGHEYRNFIIRK
ncbi:acetoacetate decarboxylase family protein [Escherichia coli]|nr:hypothetical protein [Salmonella enterica subsp. enterica serovar Mbandaka]MEB6775647.1 acetoacetate decarboxylase family protein [Escherichia coli]